LFLDWIDLFDMKGGNTMSYQKPRGTQDLLPGVVEAWQQFEQAARELGRLFHYREIRTPIFEATELFARGVGENTDVVSKEMFELKPKTEKSASLTLRPEGTAGVVRSYVENKLYAEPDVTKLYYIGPMFRHENPQAGRYRQFHQFGVEAFGSASPELDAEVIAMGVQFFESLGLEGVQVEINSVGTPQVRETYRARLQTFLAPVRSQLCSDCQTRLDKNPLRVLDCKVDQKYFDGVPSILDSLDEECANHFEAVQRDLKAMGVSYTINPKLVRGLDYYTHTAFEFKSEGIGSIDTIGGGGRYNGLVEVIGGPAQPGVGFGMGIERVLMVLAKQKGEAAIVAPSIDLFVMTLGEQAERAVPKLLQDLRKAGVSCERDFMGRKMKALFKSAERAGARYVAIIGDDELAQGIVSLKQLATGNQQSVAFDQIANVVKGEH
jgi:histidyl-tRNA synthetase